MNHKTGLFTDRKSRASSRQFSRWRLPLLLASLCALISACSVEAPEGVEPVKGFEAERYLGRWYEIARLDHRFERGLSQVTAQYAWREDGGVAVLNRGYKAEKKEWDEVEGKAYFIGEPDVGSLKVSFFGPFYGGYHIMALNEEAPDYEYSLVAGPNRDYLWLLSRTPSLPEDTMEPLLALAEARGFPMDELIMVDQSANISAAAGD